MQRAGSSIVFPVVVVLLVCVFVCMCFCCCCFVVVCLFVVLGEGGQGPPFPRS